MIQFIILIILCFIINTNAIQWCQDKNNPKTIKCFSEIQEDCLQDIFVFEENQIIFDEEINEDEIIIDCEEQHQFEFIFNLT